VITDTWPSRIRLSRVRPLRRFTGRSLAGLAAVVGAGTGFGLLLMLVRLHWAPLYQVDHDVAAWLNQRVAGNGPLVTVLQAVTDLGGRPIMLWLVGVAAVGLLIRRQPRLAIFLAVTGAGALFLDPSLKLLVGRLRPVVDLPVASAPGNSFPSGHALGSMVAYGALVLVFLPAVRPRLRPVLVAVAALVVAAVGATRVALGVHFLSDVLGGWLLGLAWLGIVAYAFQLWRGETGRPVPPLRQGLEPEAAGEIAPAPRERHLLPHPLAGWAQILTGWVLVFGVLFLIGTLVSRYTQGTVVHRLDLAVVDWFARHRVQWLDQLSYLWSKAGDTHAILAVSLVFCPLALAVVRRWRPVLFLAVLMFGELSLFLATSAAVDRPRPPVPHLDGPLPTSSFPSGHIAATMCLYVGIAVLVVPRAPRWGRWLAVTAAVVMPAGVALSRMYRGMHHPTDLLGAAVLTALWVTLLWWVVRPNEDLDDAAAPVAGRRAPRAAAPTHAPAPRRPLPGAPAAAREPNRLPDRWARPPRPATGPGRTAPEHVGGRPASGDAG